MVPNPESSQPADNDEVLSRTTVMFNTVVVLECLGSGAPKTGQTLYDDVIFPMRSRHDEMHSVFHSLSNKATLLQRLDEIAVAVRRQHWRPLIHIEAHGSEAGIEVGDNDVVTWTEIAPALARINEGCRNNLIVNATACNGWFLTGALMPSDRAPVNFIIGPPDSMSASALLAANRAFYMSLLVSFDLTVALGVMNEGRPYTEWLIKPATAEILFCRVFRQYVAELGSDVALQERENAIVADVVRSRQLTPLQSADLRLRVRTDLKDHRAAFARHRHTFLMLDLYPELEGRFGLKFEHCVPTGSS